MIYNIIIIYVILYTYNILIYNIIIFIYINTNKCAINHSEFCFVREMHSINKIELNKSNKSAPSLQIHT